MTNAVKKIVRGFFGKTEISIDGLMEIFEQTGNADVALDILLGTYEQPEIPQQAKIWGQECTFKSFEKWSDQVHYTYIGPEKDHIYIDKDVDVKTITPENYKEYKRRYDAPNVKNVYVTIKDNALHADKCALTKWLEGAKELENTPDL